MQDPKFRRFRSRPRKAVRLSQDDLVHQRNLLENQPFPQVFEAAKENINLAVWAGANRERIHKEIGQNAGILFRNFAVKSLDDFENFIAAIAGEALKYTERSSPRSQVSGRIYTSTDYPPEHPIFLHNEQSYNLTFPTTIVFHCVTKAEEGGETPIADSRKIYQRLDPEVRRRFEEQGYLYVRNFGEGFGLAWQEAFQTEDPAAVEEYCKANRIEFEWKESHRMLRTSQKRRVAAKHPRTGTLSWFNHVTFFHVSTLVPSVRDSLLENFKEEDLPNNTYYGDGSSIEPEVLEHLRRLYAEETVIFPWQEGDVLLLDNVMAAHARQPFTGRRKVVVGMADPVHWDSV